MKFCSSKKHTSKGSNLDLFLMAKKMECSLLEEINVTYLEGFISKKPVAISTRKLKNFIDYYILVTFKKSIDKIKILV